MQSEKLMGNSPYNFVGNNPILYNDPLGLFQVAPGDQYLPKSLIQARENSHRNNNEVDIMYGWGSAIVLYSASEFGGDGGGGGGAVAAQMALDIAMGKSPTPEQVKALFEATWGDQASNILATSVNGGYDLSFTATSSGNSYSGVFFSEKAVIGYLEQSGLNEGNWLDKANKMVGATATTWGVRDNLFEYAAKISEDIKDLKYYKAVKVGSYGLLGAQAVVSGLQTIKAWKKNDPNKVGVTVKAALDVTMATIGTFGGPVGWAVSGAYFLGDVMGLWGT